MNNPFLTIPDLPIDYSKLEEYSILTNDIINKYSINPLNSKIEDNPQIRIDIPKSELSKLITDMKNTRRQDDLDIRHTINPKNKDLENINSNMEKKISKLIVDIIPENSEDELKIESDRNNAFEKLNTFSELCEIYKQNHFNSIEKNKNFEFALKRQLLLSKIIQVLGYEY
jgi:hypothetical protein